MGHASMLLYSLLHLAGVKAVNPKYETLGQLAVPLDDIKRFRQLDSRCPGHPEYRWTSGVETTTGPLGQGVATSVGMAIAVEVDGRHLQPARLPDVRLRRLGAGGRRLPDGGRLGRGGLPGRPPQARQPLLDLRQQPHHDRGRDPPRLQRGRGHALRRLRLERDPGGRRERPRHARPGLRHGEEDDRPAHPDHRGQPHRLRRAPQAGHPRRPRRAAGRRRDQADQALLRLAGGREVPGARGSARALRRGAGRARGQAARRVDGALRGLQEGLSEGSRRALPHAAPPAPRGLGQGPAHVPRRREGRRRPRCLGQGPERRRAEPALAHRRLRRPRALHQDAAHLRRRGRLRGRELRRPQLPLRHPRARDGRGPERPRRSPRCGPTARAS